MNHKRLAGFTIIELLIVIVVIGILAAIIIVSYNAVVQKAHAAQVTSDLHGAAQQLETDRVTLGAYPAQQEDVNGGKGFTSKDGTTYQYSVDNSASPATYCITATNGTTVYHQDQTGLAQSGACAGHVLPGQDPAPVVVANTCPAGFIPVPGNSKYGTSDFCIMKYEARSVAGAAFSQPGGTPWEITNDQSETVPALAASACTGCHLVTLDEWLTVAHNLLNVDSNWSGGHVGSGYIFSGNNDNSAGAAIEASGDDSNGYYGTGNTSPSNQRRTLTLSNGSVIWDFAGNEPELLDLPATKGQQPGATDTGYYTAIEWKDVTIQSLLVPNVMPSYGTPAASNWTSAQGIGELDSYVGEDPTAEVHATYGGGPGDLLLAGVLGLIFTLNSMSEGVFGFRSAK